LVIIEITGIPVIHTLATIKMKLIEDKKILDIQERYERLGSVIELCAFDLPEVDESFYNLSLNAALEAMTVFQSRYVESWKKRNPTLDIKQYFNIQIFKDKIPKGEKIAIAEFFGEGFNMKAHNIDLFNYFNGGKSSKKEMNGLAHALLDPPYSLSLMESNKKLSLEYGIEEQKKMTSLFRKFILEVLNIENPNNTDNLEIYRWSDDWSNYFDAGKEWWGAFYWTVLDKMRNKIIVIAASSTD